MIIALIAILGVCCLALAAVLLEAMRRRNRVYNYDVTRDQRCDFARAGATTIDTRLERGILNLPAPQVCASIWLELRIQPTLFGRWFEPHIELSSAQGRWRQPFERGGRGLRYIELSALGIEGESTLKLTGSNLEIPDQSVRLHYLKSGVRLDGQKILVLGTHPDDAEIAAYGVYAGRDAYVVTLTAGESGEPGAFERFEGAGVYLEKGRNRAWNSVTVPMLGALPIERTANLGFFDGTLPAMREQPAVPVRSLGAGVEFLDAFGQAHDPALLMPRTKRTATWQHLVQDLEHLMKTVEPDVVVTPYPRLDWHPDHRLSTVALLQALKNLNWRRGSLLLYANHVASSDRYPFGGPGDLVSIPPGAENLYFDSIVSNPLSRERQAQKHMALDAMIDLRPVIRTDSLRSVAGVLKNLLKSKLSDGHVSYFRQAVRANELFFEVRVSSLYEPGVTEKILS